MIGFPSQTARARRAEQNPADSKPPPVVARTRGQPPARLAQLHEPPVMLGQLFVRAITQWPRPVTGVPILPRFGRGALPRGRPVALARLCARPGPPARPRLTPDALLHRSAFTPVCMVWEAQR
jgi:hypothetical protein